MQESINTLNKDLKEIIKNALEGTIHRITEPGEWMSELEDRMVEITAEGQNKGKRMKRIEDSLSDLWDNIKCTNI